MREPIIKQIMEHIKKLEMFKCNDENEEATLLQTIRIPKNLLFLTDKLPQANYEKRVYNQKKSNSFTDDIKESLPEIKSQKNVIRKRSEKKYEKDIRESDKKDSEERTNLHDRRNSVGNPLPTQVANNPT